MTKASKDRGFTLIELLVVIALLAIIASIAAPSFRRTIMNEQVRSASNDLFSALIIARSEAMKRNLQVSVIPAGGVWTAGWTVETNSSYVVQKQNALNSNVAITGPAASVVFNGSGRPVTGSAAALFTFYAGPDSTVTARCIALGLNGMPTSSKDTDGNSSNGCQ